MSQLSGTKRPFSPTHEVVFKVGKDEDRKDYAYCSKALLAASSRVAAMFVHRSSDGVCELHLPDFSPAEFDQFWPYLQPLGDNVMPKLSKENVDILVPIFGFFGMETRLDECSEFIYQLRGPRFCGDSDEDDEDDSVDDDNQDSDNEDNNNEDNVKMDSSLKDFIYYFDHCMEYHLKRGVELAMPDFAKLLDADGGLLNIGLQEVEKLIQLAKVNLKMLKLIATWIEVDTVPAMAEIEGKDDNWFNGLGPGHDLVQTLNNKLFKSCVYEAIKKQLAIRPLEQAQYVFEHLGSDAKSALLEDFDFKAIRYEGEKQEYLNMDDALYSTGAGGRTHS